MNVKSAVEAIYAVLNHTDISTQDFLLTATALESFLTGTTTFAFHPVRCTTTDGLLYHEALLRHTRADGRRVSPLSILNRFEWAGAQAELEAMLLVPLALQQAEQALVQGQSVSINLSPRTLLQNNTRTHLLAYLDQKRVLGLNPAQVVFELTEDGGFPTVCIGNMMVDTLRSRGFKVALDDFGSGVHRMGHEEFHHLDVDFVKIDFKVVKAARNCPQALEKLHTKVAYVHEHFGGVPIIAEGVKDVAHARELAALDIPYAQYFVAD